LAYGNRKLIESNLSKNEITLQNCNSTKYLGKAPKCRIDYIPCGYTPQRYESTNQLRKILLTEVLFSRSNFRNPITVLTSGLLQCLVRIRYARTRYDFPITLRFLRNSRKLSIKNTTKLGNSPTRYDFFGVYRNVYAPGTVFDI